MGEGSEASVPVGVTQPGDRDDVSVMSCMWHTGTDLLLSFSLETK